jgi:hypothetical protein
MTDMSLDPVHQKIVLAMAVAATNAVERAKQTGTKLVIWRDNHVVEIDPNNVELPKQPS